jgi:hypothetical protein
MKVQTEIPAQRIADLMITAVEGNWMTRSWCNGIYKDEAVDTEEEPWYSDPKFWAGEFTITVDEIVDEGEPPEHQNLKRHVCTQETFAKGFEIMAQKYGRHFGDFMNENEDAITADVFLQCVALGEVVYG